MRIRRRTAIWIGVAAVVLSLAAAGWRMTRPEYLRRELLAAASGALSDGWEIEVDAVDFRLLDGIALVEGIRIVRTSTREAVVKIARAEAEISFAALLGRGRLASEVRVSRPEITVERGADGEIPLLGAFRPGGGKGRRGWPRVQVADGVVRLVDRAALAEGEAIVLAVRTMTLEESRDGDPAAISGELEETGVAGDGRGALGPVHLSGEIPWGKAGLRVVVDSFEVGEPLQRRLSREVREMLAPLRHLGGTFGDGTDRALEVLLTEAPGAPTVVQVTARPRGVELNLRDHPYALDGISGDVTWNSGTRRADIRRFHLHHSGTTLQAEGHLDLKETEPAFEIRFGASKLRLDRDLYDAYPPSLRKVWDTYAFHGTVDIGTAADRGAGSFKSFLRRGPGGGPLELDITAQLVDAGLSYKGVLDREGVRHGFDWAVDRVVGEVSVKAPVDDGGTSILLQGVRGRHGETEVSAEGSVLEWPGRSKVDITLRARDVPLDDSVRDCSPVIANLFRKFGPEGRLSELQVHVVQEAIPGAPTLATVVGEFDGRGGMTWEGLPLRVEGLSGTVAYRERLLDGRKAVITEISGVKGTAAEGAEVFADGTIEGEGDRAELRLQVRARSILLDGLLEDAVRARKVEAEARLWDNLRPSGPVDLVVDVAGTSAKPDLSFTARLRGAYLEGWGEVAFPVADLTGTVTVKGGDLGLQSVRGLHAGREVTLAGGVKGLDADRTLFDLTMRTTGFPLDESARSILGPALSERLGGYFTTVRPGEGLAGDVMVRLAGPGSALEPEVVVENLRGPASPFDLRDLVFAGGTVRYAGGAVAIENLLGTMGDRELRIAAGALRFDRGEGSLTVEVRRLRFPGDLVGLVPADAAAAIEEAVPGRFIHFEGLEVRLSEGWRRVEMSGAVSLSPQKEGAPGGLGLEGTFRLDRFTLLRGEAEGDPTEISGGVDITRGALDAGVGLRDLSGRLDLGGSLGKLGRGIRGTLSGVNARAAGRELRDAGGELSLRDGIFLLSGFRGTFAGGDLGVTVEVGGQRLFEGVVTLSNGRAREFFAPSDPDSRVRGQVDATLRFRKPRAAQALLVGDGQVNIRKGTLLKVPIFDGLYGLLQISDPPEFTEGRVVFAISGDKLTFSKVDLDSRVVGIHLARGRSAAYMDGRLDLKLLPEFKTGGLLWVPFDLISTVVRPIFERMYTIYVRGTVQRPEVSFEILPGLFARDLKDGPVLLTPPPAFAVERRPPWDF